MRTYRLTVLIAIAGMLVVLGGTAHAGKFIPPVGNTFWGGIENFKGALKRVGKVSSSGFATLSIDEGNRFTYTNPQEMSFSGTVAQNGKKLLASLDPGAISDLQELLEDIIVDELTSNGIDPGMVSVTIDQSKLKIKAKLKATKRGNYILLSIKINFDAVSSLLGATTGKATTKAMLQGGI